MRSSFPGGHHHKAGLAPQQDVKHAPARFCIAPSQKVQANGAGARPPHRPGRTRRLARSSRTAYTLPQGKRPPRSLAVSRSRPRADEGTYPPQEGECLRARRCGGDGFGWRRGVLTLTFAAPIRILSGCWEVFPTTWAVACVPPQAPPRFFHSILVLGFRAVGFLAHRVCVLRGGSGGPPRKTRRASLARRPRYQHQRMATLPGSRVAARWGAATCRSPKSRSPLKWRHIRVD